MGLCNAPARFQELMVRVKHLAGPQQAFPYLDDWIISSTRYDEHLEEIKKVFQALRKTGLTVRLEKCKFFMPVVQFLGFRISKDGIQPGSKKVEAISRFPEPRDVHAVRRFIGMTSFFRRSVRRRSTG